MSAKEVKVSTMKSVINGVEVVGIYKKSARSGELSMSEIKVYYCHVSDLSVDQPSDNWNAVVTYSQHQEALTAAQDENKVLKAKLERCMEQRNSEIYRTGNHQTGSFLVVQTQYNNELNAITLESLKGE